ncbi:hypothetical protein HYS48_01905 [Candidatus Woesearchaeota archaeon]|nr:hypothetical protein [Candidatus Woesearchaeota archaeon]
MPNITIAIPEELKRNMDVLPELNWSAIIRTWLAEKVKRALLLKRLDTMLEKSELTEEECLRLGEKAKASMLKKYKAEGW